MMGTGHAISGTAVWLAGCTTIQACGGHPSFAAVTVGAAVCAGAALFPDIDHPNSTVARSVGPASRLAARWIGVFGAFVHLRTKTRWDRDDLDGHRTITHTGVWAAVSGGLVLVAQQYAAPWVAAALVFYASQLGLRTAMSPKTRNRRVRTGFRSVRRVKLSTLAVLLALVLAFVAYQLTPTTGWWLGLAVGVGSLAHCLGDSVTNSACPVLWPIPIGPVGRRRRWYPVGPPRRLRFSAGDVVENKLVRPLLWVATGTLGMILFWPTVQPTVAELIQMWKSNTPR